MFGKNLFSKHRNMILLALFFLLYRNEKNMLYSVGAFSSCMDIDRLRISYR